MPKPLTITGFMTVQPGTEPLLLQHIDALVENTRAEAGCLNYDFFQHNRDAHRFVFYENFVDQAAFDFHLAQPYTQEWIKFCELYGARFEVQQWTMLSQRGGARQADIESG